MTTALRNFLATHTLSAGLGTRDAPCSIAAINLVLTNYLTDSRPDCMHPVIHTFVIRIQDAMPHDVRNSARYKSVLPLTLGTVNSTLDHEQILIDWLFTKVLPLVPHLGTPYEAKWLHMLKVRTADAAYAAACAVDIDAGANGDAVYAAYAAYAAARSPRSPLHPTANAAAAADASNDPDFWAKVDVPSLIEALTQ